MIKSFKVNIPKKITDNIYSKVKKYPWKDMPILKGWEHGSNIKFMKKITKYWMNNYNWKYTEKKINSFKNFKVKINDLNIHFIKERGSGSKPQPLLLNHGWPGSILEFIDIIDKLAHPEKYGGDPEDSFDVIVPSLPGFGFSDKPTKPIGPRKIASIFNTLMIKKLGYKNYMSQGGDFGGTISSWLAYDFPKFCKAIHINILIVRHPDGPKTIEEIKWENKFNKDQIMENGYRIQQSTKPQTLSYSMMDSPVGVAAWIIEKMYGWSDLRKKKFEKIISKEKIISNIMIYLVTKTFSTSTWIYYGRRQEGGRFLPKKGLPIKVPTAIAEFPKEFLTFAPKSYVKRIYNIKRWTKMSKGGHFAALEQPKLLLEDIKKFYKDLKDK